MTKEIRVSKLCYISTPEYLDSFVGRYLATFQDQGQLRLTLEALVFEGRGYGMRPDLASLDRATSFHIPIANIKSIGVGEYAWWRGSLGLVEKKYIAITYMDDESERTIRFTPAESMSVLGARADDAINAWIVALRQVIAAAESDVIGQQNAAAVSYAAPITSEYLVRPTTGVLVVVTLVLGLIPILLYAYFYLFHEWYDSHGPLWESSLGGGLVFWSWVTLTFFLPLVTFVTGIVGSTRTKRLRYVMIRLPLAVVQFVWGCLINFGFVAALLD